MFNNKIPKRLKYFFQFSDKTYIKSSDSYYDPRCFPTYLKIRLLICISIQL